MEVVAKGCRVSFRDDEIVLKLTGEVVIHVCESTKNHCIIRCQWVNYVV